MNTFILGVVAAAFVFAGAGMSIARFQRTRQDVADAKKKLHDLQQRWWVDLRALFAPLGLVIALAIVIATLVIIKGGPQ